MGNTATGKECLPRAWGLLVMDTMASGRGSSGQHLIAGTSAWARLALLMTLALAVVALSSVDVAAGGSDGEAGPGEGSRFTTIQDAINSASNGDVISIPAGTYTESVLVNKEVTLEGAGASSTTITAATDRTVRITSSYAGLKGLTVRYTGTDIGRAAVHLGGGLKSVKIDDCVITSLGIGIDCCYSDLRIRNSTISDCRQGISVTNNPRDKDTGSLDVFDCVIQDCSENGIDVHLDKVNGNTGLYSTDHKVGIYSTELYRNGNAGLNLYVSGYARYWHQTVSVNLDVKLVDSTIEWNKHGLYTFYSQGTQSSVAYTLGLIRTEVADNANYGVYLDNIGVLEDSSDLHGNGIADWRGFFHSCGDCTWHAGSTYLFTDVVTVGEEDTLTIEPGATVNFADDKGKLLVNGYLGITGDASSMVTLSNSDNTPSGSWLGIEVRNTGNANDWDHLTVQYAKRGIHLADSELRLADSVLAGCSEAGVYCENSRLRIEDTLFDRCSMGLAPRPYGGSSSASYVEAGHCRFANCTQSGIDAYYHVTNGNTGTYRAYLEMYINDSVVEDGADKGLQVDAYGGAQYWHQYVDIDIVIRVCNSSLAHNKHGVYTMWEKGSRAEVDIDLSVVRSSITGNSNTGVLARNVAPLVLSHCTLEGNKVGLELRESSRLDISNDTFGGNEVGILVRQSQANPEIHFNLISGNTAYGIDADDHTGVVQAGYNWWGHGTGPTNAAKNPGGRGDRITDNVIFEPCSFGEDLSPATASTGEPYPLTFDVFDFFTLTGPTVEHWFGDGAHEEGAMAGTDLLTFTIAIPEDSIEPLRYIVKGLGPGGSEAAVGVREVPVLDDDAPAIDASDNPGSATTGDMYTFRFDISDNIAVSRASVRYWFGDGPETNISLELDGTYMATVDVPAGSLDALHFIAYANDTADNWAWTDAMTVEVVDDDAPTVSEDRTPSEGTTGDAFVFAIVASDNIEVDGATVEYWYGDGPRTTEEMAPGSGWEVTTTVPSDATVLHYVFDVRDASGNHWASVACTVTVKDNDAPTITNVTVPSPENPREPVTVSLRAMDNMGVVDVKVRVMKDGVLLTTETMLLGDPCTMEYLAPMGFEGSLAFHFIVMDAAGNEAYAGPHYMGVMNVPPVLSGAPTWDVTEETDASLDLSPYIWDPNTQDEVNVSCTDPNVTVVGKVLRVRYDEEVDDHNITVRLSDGEAFADFLVQVNIIPVNDVPIIRGMFPLDGTTFKKGEEITFECGVTDEDFDLLTYTWYDGKTKLDSGATYNWAYSFTDTGLSAGAHKITLTVTDGTVVVEQTRTIEVVEDKPEEPGGIIPGFGSVSAMAVLALVASIAAIRRRCGP